MTEHSKTALLAGFFLLTFTFSGQQASAQSSSPGDSVIVEYSTRDSNNQVIVRQEKVDPRTVGIVVIDMWNWHWCKTAAARVGCMVPRMNKCLEGARKMGMQVFLCPTDVANNYVGTPQREQALAVNKLPLPPSLNILCPHPGGGGCMCGEDHCITTFGWNRMADSLRVLPEDLISSGPQELYSLCKARGITQLWYMGVHTNNCVLGKPEGMRNMMNYGLHCALVRDLQDPETFYDPVKGVTPDDNNARIVAHFEKYLAPSINLGDFLALNGWWDKDWIVDPVRITPWGKPERPHQFRDRQIVTLTTPLNPGVEIHYTLDGSEPTLLSPLYARPFTIDATTKVRAIAFRNGRPSNLESTGYFTKLPEAPGLPEVYLSTLTWIDLNRPSRIPVADRSIMKTKLRIHGETFTRGMGTQAPSFLTYAIEPGYAFFVARCGVDDYLNDINTGREVTRFPTVVFKVFIDGNLAGESPVMRSSQWAWSFHIP
ncbi:MAG: NPCBM/NEW2 domain-containing protein, partial [Puia sp.]|nr:NPCBM/NEW2 domain-containing protein [Puia sp.]